MKCDKKRAMILVEVCDTTGRPHRASGSLSAEDILNVVFKLSPCFNRNMFLYG